MAPEGGTRGEKSVTMVWDGGVYSGGGGAMYILRLGRIVSDVLIGGCKVFKVCLPSGPKFVTREYNRIPLNIRERLLRTS